MKAKFGEFEFDAVTGELRRRGQPVRLQAQPARVLAMLVEHAGQVVTRDALREALWGGDTFVDFDKGLNFAIAQVRTALGDSADAPSFVRTLPKRGYQFIAPTEVADEAYRIDSESAALDLDAGAARPRLSVVNGGSAVRWTVVAVAILCVAAASAWWAGRSTLDRHTLAVVPFDNETGNSDLDRYAQNVTHRLVTELTTGAGGRLLRRHGYRSGELCRHLDAAAAGCDRRLPDSDAARRRGASHNRPAIRIAKYTRGTV
jgi:DNA-binding winged helix-turn-helix (wHTH) protein